MTKMVSRVLIVLGAVTLTCTPAAVAVSGSSEAAGGDAAAEQYGKPTPAPTTVATATPTITVAPTITTGGPENPPGGGPNGTPPSTDTPTTPAAETREQGTTASGALPFTGGPVLPLVVAALVLLGLGGLLRRSSAARPTD